MASYMRLLFISNYFPPEVNAPATRLYEHARQWVADGHQVEVITSVPNFPEGEIYEGYENRYQEETVDGIPVMRVPMYVAENKGVLKRTLSYLSFMLTSIWYSRRVRQRPDIVVATSPQFFAALGGYFIARLKRVPFVMEVRDLWPESIVAVGAVKRNLIIRVFEWLEAFLYRHSDHIVVVTDAFKDYIVGKGISGEKVSVLKNGFDMTALTKPLDEIELGLMRQQFGLQGKFVASYIGTIGMAHGVEIMMEAAQRCPDPDVVFMVVGTGAEREKLEARQAELNLSNVRLIPKQPKEKVPYLLALSDVSVVHLKASPLFKTVIPSKIFEAMAMRKPIVLGVEGEARAIIEEAEAGIPITPEHADELVQAVCALKSDQTLYSYLAENGFAYVNQYHDRRKLARRFWAILESVVNPGIVCEDTPEVVSLAEAA